jgi:hypothetical protein
VVLAAAQLGNSGKNVAKSSGALIFNSSRNWRTGRSALGLIKFYAEIHARSTSNLMSSSLVFAFHSTPLFSPHFLPRPVEPLSKPAEKLLFQLPQLLVEQIICLVDQADDHVGGGLGG